MKVATCPTSTAAGLAVGTETLGGGAFTVTETDVFEPEPPFESFTVAVAVNVPAAVGTQS